MVKKDIVDAIIEESVLGGFKGAARGYNKSAKGILHKIANVSLGVMNGAIDPCVSTFTDYLSTSEYCVKKDKQKIELKILNKNYRMKRVIENATHNGFFYSSLKGMDTDNIEAKIKLDKKTELWTLNIVKNNGKYVLDKAIYGKILLYERK